MIIDAQVQLWEGDRPDRPWVANPKAHLPEPMTAERMLSLMDEAGIDRAVISPAAVTAQSPLYALEVAAKYPQHFRVMPWFQPGKQEHFDALPRWLDTPGVCSMRLTLNGKSAMNMLEDGSLDPLWLACERYRIPIAVYRSDGVGVVEPAMRKYPEMPLIIDHFNSFTPEDRERKMKEMEVLAQYPNVCVKISCLPKFTQAPPPYREFEPFIKRIHAVYGAKRLMWGSVQTEVMAHNGGSYRDGVDLIRVSAAEYLPAEDIESILHGTAARVFNWPA